MIMRILTAVAFLIAAVAPARATEDPVGFAPINRQLSASDILEKAHAAAGGEAWRRPKSLRLSGYAMMYRGGEAALHERYEMWRVYDWDKREAHAADGKVRIEGWKDGKTVLLLTFDGAQTYDMKGPVADQTANAQWASNFGFGAVRHGLDAGWTAKRLPDDWMDGRGVYMIELADPQGGLTRFGVAHDGFEVVYAGFDTPRGWHERRYSDYFRKNGVSWSQPGRVRLYYDGVKQNEIMWTDFEVNADMSGVGFTGAGAPLPP